MDRRTEGSAIAVALAFVAVAGVAAFFLLRYPLEQIRYPVGWDAPWYAWRARAVALWDRLSLGLHGWWGIGPLVAIAAAGWLLAWFGPFRSRRSRPAAG